jgi:hypothetical protein
LYPTITLADAEANLQIGQLLIPHNVNERRAMKEHVAVPIDRDKTKALIQDQTLDTTDHENTPNKERPLPGKS